MQEYKIRPDGLKEIKKQMLVRTIPIMLIAVIVGITISVVNSKDNSSEVNILPMTIPFFAVVVGLSLYRGVNRQRSLLESYQLVLTNNLVTREQLNTQTISIYFNDIKEIVKNKNGSFIIKGKDPTDLIAIPAQIENYAELEIELNRIKPIATKSSQSILQKYSIAITIFTFALMVAVYTVTNKIIVAVSGTILIAILSWSFYDVLKNKSVDAKTKRGMWWALLVLASIIGVMIMKLTRVQKT